MADAEPREVADSADDEGDEPKPSKKGKDWTGGKEFEYVSRTGDARTEKLTSYNIFCPTCAPPEDADTPGAVAPGAPGTPEMAFPEARRTSLPLALVATMEAEAPGISLATIAHNEGGAGVYAVGEDVMTNVNLHAVDLGVVYLQTASGLEFLPLSSGDAPPPKATKKPDEPSKPKKPNKYAVEGASDAIKCTKNSNGHSCTVERKFINQLIGNPAQLATQARARPYSKKGLEGYQLTRIRKGSIPYMMGIRTGNVIKSINGTELKSLDGAMALYARLRNAKHLTIDYVHGRKEKLYERRLEIDVI